MVLKYGLFRKKKSDSWLLSTLSNAFNRSNNRDFSWRAPISELTSNIGTMRQIYTKRKKGGEIDKD